MNNKFNTCLDLDARRVNKNVKIDLLGKASITITGATGLIGLNIIMAIIFHNINSPKNKIKINALSLNKPRGLFKKILNHSDINMIAGNITDPLFVNNIPSSDYIVHAAGYGQPIKFIKNKIETISINTSATINLGKKLLKGGSFLFLSTSEVYSGSSSQKNKETDIGTTNPFHPRSCYIESKRTGEAIVDAFNQSGINSIAARITAAYGPGVKKDDTRVLNQLIQQGINGSINLLDSGSAVRTYCYISDVVTTLINILIKNNHKVYNVGGKSSISIRKLALKIGEKMGVSVNIPENKTFMKEAPKNVSIDLSRVEEEYGNKKYVDLDTGVNQTVDWIKLNR